MHYSTELAKPGDSLCEYDKWKNMSKDVKMWEKLFENVESLFYWLWHLFASIAACNAAD